jgi:hypothetical protein
MGKEVLWGAKWPLAGNRQKNVSGETSSIGTRRSRGVFLPDSTQPETKTAANYRLRVIPAGKGIPSSCCVSQKLV